MISVDLQCILNKYSNFLYSPYIRCLAGRKVANKLMYSSEVHDHFNYPRNVGSLDSSDPNVGTAVVGKASCGDVIKLQVKIEDGIIQDVKFKTFGCGSAIASSSFASELIKGKSCEEAEKIKNIDIANHLKLPPIKLHCSLLTEDAIKFAIGNYRQKQLSNAKEN